MLRHFFFSLRECCCHLVFHAVFLIAVGGCSIMPSFPGGGALSTMTILLRTHQNVGLFRISRVNSFFPPLGEV
jgi:hypothetical protein